MARAVLTDIEGTTTPIAFVKDVLFPYARLHLAAFIAARHRDPVVAAALQDVATIVGCRGDDHAHITNTLIAWTDADSKATALKSLQGMIWADGYASGALRATVYPDAAAQLRRWHVQGHALFVYSSGSVQAQRLLFAHSDQGSLLSLFSGYFDTAIGAKREPASYRNIAQQISRPSADFIFLSDVTAELDAARAAGMTTCWLVRANDIAPTAQDLAANTHPVASSFSEVTL